MSANSSEPQDIIPSDSDSKTSETFMKKQLIAGAFIVLSLLLWVGIPAITSSPSPSPQPVVTKVVAPPAPVFEESQVDKHERSHARELGRIVRKDVDQAHGNIKEFVDGFKETP